MAFGNLLNISAKLISFGLKSFRIRHFKCNIVEVQLNIMNGPCDEITIKKKREAFLCVTIDKKPLESFLLSPVIQKADSNT